MYIKLSETNISFHRSFMKCGNFALNFAKQSIFESSEEQSYKSHTYSRIQRYNCMLENNANIEYFATYLQEQRRWWSRKRASERILTLSSESNHWWLKTFCGVWKIAIIWFLTLLVHVYNLYFFFDVQKEDSTREFFTYVPTKTTFLNFKTS